MGVYEFRSQHCQMHHWFIVAVCCSLLVCVLFSLVWKHVCWGKEIGRTIWKKEIGKGIVKRKGKRHFTNMKFPRKGINMCWFGESVIWTSMLNLKHQNQLCCFVAIHKKHKAPVHTETFNLLEVKQGK